MKFADARSLSLALVMTGVMTLSPAQAEEAKQAKLLGIGDLPIDLPLEGELDVIEGELELPIDLPTEGELPGGLLEGDLLEELFELVEDVTELPLPILGPDDFEPDNSPSLAVWTGLQDVTSLLTDHLLPLKDTHNFHVREDEDWNRFLAITGELVQIETRDVYPLADTFLTVYREAAPGETLPKEAPEGCGAAWMEGPEGELLIAVACNDDTGEVGPQGIRSRVQFVAPATGTYYARVTLSEKAPFSKSSGSDGAETTYNFQATSKGIFSATLYCTVIDNETGEGVSGATVTLQPYSMTARQRNSVYVVSGIPEGNYTIAASASGYESELETVSIDGGTIAEVIVRMNKTTSGGSTGGTAGGTTGGTIGQEDPPSFDYAAPYGAVTLNEVLRAVQLFNARRYHCNGSTEDAYAPYQGSTQCAPHPLDYKNQDWSIDLSELLRLVQFFSLGGYHPCANGEGGLCAGTAR